MKFEPILEPNWVQLIATDMTVVGDQDRVDITRSPSVDDDNPMYRLIVERFLRPNGMAPWAKPGVRVPEGFEVWIRAGMAHLDTDDLPPVRPLRPPNGGADRNG